MTLDEPIEQLTKLRTVSTGASIANVRIVTARSDRPLDRVYYQRGEIVLISTAGE